MDGPHSDKPILDLDDFVASRNSQYSGVRQKFDRCFQMMNTYPPSQVLRRLSKVTRNRLGIRYQPNNAMPKVRVRENMAFQQLAKLTKPNSQQQKISGGRIALLNQVYEVGSPIDWRTEFNPRPHHLWRFQLHYHEWLLSFGSQSDFTWETIEHWIENNTVGDAQTHDDAWHPYCISRRIPVWQKLLAGSADRSSDTVLLSLFNQADFLSKNLETDLRGNHLLENLHALAMSACFFEGDKPANWRNQCVDHLSSELKIQILQSGEHYEKSPMYQCVVCANLMQLSIVSKVVSQKLHDLAIDYASRMSNFLESILCPDGEIPLLSDSCFGEAPSIESLMELAVLAEIDFNVEESKGRAVALTDYWIHRSAKQNFLLFDVGELAADGLPGHAHCDLLNVVGSVRGKRIIVDSGNGSYDLDSIRAYCRSSVAHNVLTVDGIDHADVWSKFRMGFRGRPLSFRNGSKGDFDWAIAEHDAYSRRGINSVKRIILSFRSDLLWICLDSIEGIFTSHQLEGYLHFSETAKISHHGKQVCVEVDEVNVSARFFGCESVELARSWRCSEFGEKLRNYTAVYRASAPKCQLLGWSLCNAKDIANTSLMPGSTRTSVVVTYNDRQSEIDLANL
jgi:uncharacterized heparinase superfamily protein